MELVFPPLLEYHSLPNRAHQICGAPVAQLDRAPASGAGCMGSNPVGGTRIDEGRWNRIQRPSFLAKRHSYLQSDQRVERTPPEAHLRPALSSILHRAGIAASHRRERRKTVWKRLWRVLKSPWPSGQIQGRSLFQFHHLAIDICNLTLDLRGLAVVGNYIYPTIKSVVICGTQPASEPVSLSFQPLQRFLSA